MIETSKKISSSDETETEELKNLLKQELQNRKVQNILNVFQFVRILTM